MKIPSGDLAPVRRSRRGGASYGRRRRRSGRTGLAVLLTVAFLAAVAGGVYLLKRDDGRAPTRTTTACPTGKPAPVRTRTVAALPAPPQVRLMLLNGTPRNGLGAAVGQQLSARGFVVSGTGNAPAALAGPSRVTYGPGGSAAARVVADHVLGAAVVGVPAQPPRSVQLVLGSAFVRLRTPAEVAALRTRRAAAAAPVKPSARPAGCP